MIAEVLELEFAWRRIYMKSAESILLPIQAAQQKHDLLAHKDILNLNAHTLLKHMILHFLKYSGKMAQANHTNNTALFSATLVDTIIICLATANALNVSLGKHIADRAFGLNELCSKLGSNVVEPASAYGAFALVTIAGRMAKSIESTDHLEKGNPRIELEALIIELTKEMLGVAGALKLELGNEIEKRWKAVEAKSIFSDLAVA